MELFLDVTNKEKVISSLEKNEIDFALVSVLPKHIQVEKTDLMKNDLFLVAGNEEPVSDPERDKEVFEKFPLIYREKGSDTRQIMEKYIRTRKLSVDKKMELTSNEAVKQAVLAGLCYSIMPIIGIKNDTQKWQPTHYTMSGASHKNHLEPDLAQEQTFFSGSRNIY